jgi:hypothetical protein
MIEDLNIWDLLRFILKICINCERYNILMKIQYLIIDDFIPITFIADERSKSLKFYDCVITILDIVNSVSVISSYWRSAKVDVNSINDF